MNFLDIVPGHIGAIEPYKPGKPVEEVERGLGIAAIKMASNENPWGPSPKAIEAVRSYLEKGSRYPEDTGFYLRRRLAAHYKVDMDDIIIGAGSSEILGMAFHAMVSAGDEVLTSQGSFVLYYLYAQIQGATLIAEPAKDFGFDLAAMADRISSKTRLILLANPNNPTGTMMSRVEVAQFMERVPEHALVIFDEAYFEYVDDKNYPDSFEYLTAGRGVLILRTFSKAYGLAGFRVGYGIGRRDVIDVLHKVRPPFNTPSVAQIAALAALDDQSHVHKSVQENRKELSFLTSELDARSMYSVRSVANFILVDVAMPAADAFEKLLHLGVIVRPMEGPGFPTMVRVSVGTHEENEVFLKALDKLR